MPSAWKTRRHIKPFTAHTNNPVPFIIVNDKENIQLKESGTLADVAQLSLIFLELINLLK